MILISCAMLTHSQDDSTEAKQSSYLSINLFICKNRHLQQVRGLIHAQLGLVELYYSRFKPFKPLGKLIFFND